MIRWSPPPSQLPAVKPNMLLRMAIHGSGRAGQSSASQLRTTMSIAEEASTLSCQNFNTPQTCVGVASNQRGKAVAASHMVVWLLVRSIVHGTHETVNRICDHPDIQAISFVGSNAAGQYIYERGSRSGKRIQVLGCMLFIGHSWRPSLPCTAMLCKRWPVWTALKSKAMGRRHAFMLISAARSTQGKMCPCR